MTDSSNPWEAAANATEAAFSTDLYGQIGLDIWFCVLQKGIGKVPFDPQIHPMAQRRTAIDLNITELSGNNYPRSFIAEIGTDGWLKVVLPSLKALGVTDLQTINNAWIHTEMVGYAEYTNKDGEKRTKTAPKILAIYPNRAACESAAQAAAGTTTGPDWLVDQPAGGSVATEPPTNTSDVERQVAVAFLPGVLKPALNGNGFDAAKVAEAIKTNPILARYFTPASPEVAQAMDALLKEPAF